MTLIPIIDEFERLGKEIPRIIRFLEAQSLEFEPACGKLLNRYTELAEERNMPFAADLALLRGKMLSYTDDLGLLTSQNRKIKRQARQKHMLGCLHDAYELVNKFFEKDNSSLRECESTLNQILSVAAARKSLPLPGSMSDNERLETAWHMLRNDPELAPAITHITGIAGVYNVRILLDRNLIRFTG